MFAQLQYVEVIDLAENNITEIQKQSFTELFLTGINISYNSLSKIEPRSFVSCNNITFLDLSHNLLENIPKLAFDENSYASAFDVSYNRFTNMSQLPLQNMTGIRVLNVSATNISLFTVAALKESQVVSNSLFIIYFVGFFQLHHGYS